MWRVAKDAPKELTATVIFDFGLSGEYSNLIAKLDEIRLLISVHLDTFPAYSHPQPYTLREDGDRLIARGVVDIKGQIAALLLAVS